MQPAHAWSATAIAYEIRGDGSPALVFVHGWSCGRGYWAAQVAALSAHALVVSIDLAGHGASEATRQDWSIAAFAGDVSSVVEELGLEDVILIGHSMGADVVLEAARSLVGRVSGIVWVDEFQQLDRFMDEQQVHERLAPFRADFARAARSFVRGMFPSSADPALVERVAIGMSAAPQQVAIPALEATWNHARLVPSLLEELRLPVVAINSEHQPTDVASLQRHGVEVMIIPGVGHFPMLERPGVFNAVLARALGRFDAQRERSAAARSGSR